MSIQLAVPAGVCGLLACKLMNSIVGKAFDNARFEDSCKATALKVAGIALMFLSLVVMILSVATISYGLTLALCKVFSPLVSQVIATVAIIVPVKLASRTLEEWFNIDNFKKAPQC